MTFNDNDKGYSHYCYRKAKCEICGATVDRLRLHKEKVHRIEVARY